MATKPKQQMTTKEQEVRIETFKRTATVVTLIGETPLIVHAWDQKTKFEMLAKQMGAKLDRQDKDPYQDFIRSMYRFDDGAYGFPVVAFKEMMATVTADLPGITRAQVYRNITVTGRRGFQVGAFADLLSPHELADVYSPNAPTMREDMVRLSDIGRTADIHYRAEFWPWAARFTLGYNERMFSSESVMNLLAQAGFTVGVGEWRQEKGGSNGIFRIASREDLTAVEKWIKAGPKEPTAVDSRAWLSEKLKTLPTKDQQRASKGNGHAVSAKRGASETSRV